MPTTLDLLLSVRQAEAGSVHLPRGCWSTLQSHILAVWVRNMKWLQRHLLLICRLHWCLGAIYQQNQPTWTASSNILPLSVGSRSPKNQFVLNNIHTPTQEFLCKRSGDTQLEQNLFSRTNNETWLGSAWFFMFRSDKRLFDYFLGWGWHLKGCRKLSSQTRYEQAPTLIRSSLFCFCYSPLLSFFHCCLHLPLSICFLILWLRRRSGDGGKKMIGGRLTHLLADALLIPGSHQGEKWRFVALESDWCNSTWMSSIKTCVYLCKQVHQGCLALHLFISADIWNTVIIIFSYTSPAFSQQSPFSPTMLFVSICKDFFLKRF